MIINATLSLEELQTKARDLRAELIDFMAKNGGYLKDDLAYIDIVLCLLMNIESEYKILMVPEYLNTILERLDINLKPYHFSVAQIMSMAMGLAYAKEKVVVILDSAYLSDGFVLENLFKIAKENLAITVIVGDDLSQDTPIKLKSRPLKFTSRLEEGHLISGVMKTIKGNKISSSIYKGVRSAKNTIKKSFEEHNVFSLLGYEYVGPLDGHNLKSLLEAFKQIKDQSGPLMIHAIIKKGYGYEPVEKGLVVMPSLTPPFKKESGLALQKEVKGYNYLDELLIRELDNYLALYDDVKVFLFGDALENHYAKLLISHPNKCFDLKKHYALAMSLAYGAESAAYRVFILMEEDKFCANINVLYELKDYDPNIKIFLLRGGIRLSYNPDSLMIIRALKDANTILCNDFKTLEDAFRKSLDHKGLDIFYLPDHIFSTKDGYQDGPYLLYDKDNKKTILTYGDGLDYLYKAFKDQDVKVNLVRIDHFIPLDEDLLDALIKTQDFIWIYDLNSNSGAFGKQVASYFEKVHYSNYQILKVKTIPDNNVSHIRNANHLTYQDILEVIQND